MQKGKGIVWIIIIVVVLVIVIALLAGGKQKIGNDLNSTGQDLNAINTDGIDTTVDQGTTPTSTVSGSGTSADITTELNSIGTDLDGTSADSVDTNI